MSARNDPVIAALVRGVLWPGFLGRVAPDWLRRELDGGLAGVVYFAYNLDAGDPAQPARLSAALRAEQRHPLIGIDEEGGNVTRLEAASGSTLPGHAQLGRLDDLDATRSVGRELGRRVLDAGANVVIAPDADVNVDPRNPVIGVRAFGDDSALVSRHVARMVDGIQSTGAVACAKHYPGHGDTSLDSHVALPVSGARDDGMLREHLAPFDAAIAAGVRAIMTAHIVVPHRGELPATLNADVLGELRERGFEGVIVTDALDMGAVRDRYTFGGAAVRALAAGAELLCTGSPANPSADGSTPSDEDLYREVFSAICAAVDDGTLGVGVLEKAAARVRSLADWTADAAAASATLEPESSANLGQMVRDSISVSGVVAPSTGPTAVCDLRARATIAVATRTASVTEELRRGGPARGIDLADVRSVDADERVVVLADSIAAGGNQRVAVAEIAAVRPDAIVVNAGVPAPPEVSAGLVTISTLADSRLSAMVIAEMVRGQRSAPQ